MNIERLSKILLGISIILLCSCDPFYFLVLENKSSHNILAYWATDYAHPEVCSVYPDTLLPDKYFYHCYYNGNADNSIDSHIIPSNSKSALEVGLEFDVFFSILPQDTLSVFIIHGDTALTKPWKEIKEENNYIVRYDLSYNDFMNLNGCIPFPPTEAMRDMKMWPPYEEVKNKYK